jgi:exonuclease SbcC
MEIRALELENVKSYVRQTIPFAPGTIAICGPNGSGKSTILEAIGYALFDVAPCRPIGNLVREGAKTASVTVAVTASDEREYQVVRRCGARTQYYIYDPELGQKLADGPTDVAAWLREQFGVEETVDLAALFRDAVGVPQGLLTAAFLLTPEKRKGTFDPLLRVEEYNQAFGKLLDARRALEAQVQALELQIAGYQSQVQELPRLEAEAATLGQEIDAARDRLAQLAPSLGALAEEKWALEAAREHLRELSERAARLDERIEALALRVQQAGQAVEQAQEAVRILEECEAGHQAYLAAQERRQILEGQEAERARLQEEIQARRTRQQVTLDRLARRERDLQAAREAVAEAERLRPAAQEQERLQQELLQARAQIQQWEASTRRLAQELRHLGQLEARLQQITEGLDERARLEKESEEQERSLEALGEALRSVRASESKASALLEQLRTQGETLASLEAAQCPVCESELTPARRSELQAQNRQKMLLQEGALAELRRQATALAADCRQAAQALKARQEQLSQLPRPAERDALQADCDRQRATVREVEEEVGRLEGARPRAQALTARLAGLGDLQAAYQRALAIAAQAPEQETGLERERREAQKLEEQLAALEGELTAFDQLNEALSAARGALLASEPAHRRYLQYEREAGELSARASRLDELQRDLASAEAGRQQLQGELDAAQAAYRPEDYERVAAAYLQASGERSRLEAQVQIKEGQLQGTQGRIEALRLALQQLQAAGRELETWRDLGQLLDYLRRVLKEAGPHVTRVLVEIISFQAARLYADITNDAIGRLHWSEDYEVRLEHKSHERTFQQLSGGEQMAAALATRLALLREVSDIDLVFFDEPTSNLDDTRRDNLADQILAIRHFRQLFVVSHDDTFERATDHTVRLAKEGGVSRVVA